MKTLYLLAFFETPQLGKVDTNGVQQRFRQSKNRISCSRRVHGWDRRIPIRLIKDQAIPNCGSYEAQFPDGRASAHFYFEDNADRRLRPEQLTREQALDGARAAGGDQSVFK